MLYKRWRERLRLATSSAAKLDQLRGSFPDCETVVANYLNLDSLNDALKGVRTVFVITPDFIDEPVAMSNLIEAVRRVPDFRQIVRILGDPPNMSFNKRSEEHTSELQSLMRISYAVLCLKKKQL